MIQIRKLTAVAKIQVAIIFMIAIQSVSPQSLGATSPASREDVELTGLLHAKSVDELTVSTLNASELSSRNDECLAELEIGVLPRSCFKALRLQSKKDEAWLIKECVARAKKSTSRQDLDRRNEELPESCRLAATDRLDDLKYLDQNERPSEVWTTWTRN